jgi:hypothetical protein
VFWAAFLAVAPPGALGAEEEAGEAREEPGVPIAMGLSVDRKEFWVGEPIVLRCRIVNWLAPMLAMQGIFGLHGADSEFRILKNNELGEPYHAYFDETPQTPKKAIVDYAKAYEFDIVVAYDRKSESRLALEEPGAYMFMFRQAIRYTNIYSAGGAFLPLVLSAASPEVNVVDPPPEATGALELLKANPVAILDINRQLATVGNQWLLQKIAREYPESRYAPYCLHALGNLYDLLGLRHVGARDQAAAFLRDLVEKYPDYPLRGEALITLAGLHRNSYRMDAAAEIAGRLLAESPDNLARFRKMDVMKPLRGGPSNPWNDINEMCWELFSTTELTDAYIQARIEDLR